MRPHRLGQPAQIEAATEPFRRMQRQQRYAYHDQPHHHRPAPYPADLVQQAAPQSDRYRGRRRQNVAHGVRQCLAFSITGPESMQEVEFGQLEAQGQRH